MGCFWIRAKSPKHSLKSDRSLKVGMGLLIPASRKRAPTGVGRQRIAQRSAYRFLSPLQLTRMSTSQLLAGSLPTGNLAKSHFASPGGSLPDRSGRDQRRRGGGNCGGGGGK